MLILTIISLIINAYLTYRAFKDKNCIKGLQESLDKIEQSIPNKIKEAVTEALNKQRSVVQGQVSEQVVPFFKGFPYRASELKFFGSPFDFVGIIGMNEARDGESEIEKIVFIDVKRNTSSLSKIQRKIRNAITEGRVTWETIKIDNDNNLSIK